MNILLLMMGGSGTRFGADIPKQYVKLENRPIFSYILEAYQACQWIDKIVIVSHGNWITYVKKWVNWLQADKVSQITAGGCNRSASVRNGLVAMKDFASAKDVILIHDATHPYCDKEGTRKVIEAVGQYGGATLGQCQFDTVYQTDDNGFIEKVVPRQKIVSGASPEAFPYQTISDIYLNASAEELENMTSAGAIALAHGIPMKVIPANELNLKITYPNDMKVLMELLNRFFPEAKQAAQDNSQLEA